MKKSKALVKVMPPSKSKEGMIASHLRDMLVNLGEDPQREGLLRTPERYERAMKFLTSGYETNLEDIVNHALFHSRLRRNGDRQGHRVLQYVRASSVAILWQGSRGVSAEGQSDRPEQDPAHREHVRAPPATAGTSDDAGR